MFLVMDDFDGLDDEEKIPVQSGLGKRLWRFRRGPDIELPTKPFLPDESSLEEND